MDPVRKMVPSSQFLATGPKLQLWYPGRDEESPPPSGGTTGLSPQMTLKQFFERYYLPVILHQDGPPAVSTVKLYRDAVDRWELITGSKPISCIDDILVTDYTTKLRVSTYKRSKFGQEYPLKPFTIKRHLDTIRRIIYRVGPQTDPKRKTKNMLDDVPYISSKAPRNKVKPPFSVQHARQICGAAAEMIVPVNPGISPTAWWLAFIACLFYTALRVGTVLLLRWRHLVRDEEGIYWLDVPAEIVHKTEKPTRIQVHGLLLEALLAIRGDRSDDDLIFPLPVCRRYLRELHIRIQQLAKIPAAKMLSIHAWRRTHLVELARLGYNHAQSVAQAAADHSDAATTKNHYCDIANEVRIKLPALWVNKPKGEDPTQLHLF